MEGICGALGEKVRIWRLPEGLMLFAARMGDWLHLPLNTRTDGELSGFKRQDQGCFGDERDAGAGEGWVEGGDYEFCGKNSLELILVVLRVGLLGYCAG